MARAIHSHSQWRVGDQLGAGNHLTPEKRLEALELVDRGQLFDLGQTIEAGAPRFEPVQTPYLLIGAPNWHGSLRRRRRAGATNDAGANLTNKAGAMMTNQASAMQTVDGGGMIEVKGGLVKIG